MSKKGKKVELEELELDEEMDEKGEKLEKEEDEGEDELLRSNGRDGATGGAESSTGATASVDTAIPDREDNGGDLNPRPIPMLLRDDRKWPKIPKQIKGWESAWEVFSQFTTAQWSHWTAYLYRRHPFILKDKPIFIDKFNGTEQGADPRFNWDQIVNLHGGGNYRLTVNDSDLRSEVCNVSFEVPWDLAMPKVNLNELIVEHPRNKTYVEYLKKEGLLTEDGQVAAQVKADQAANVGVQVEGTIGAVHKMTMDLMNQFKANGASSPATEMMMKTILDMLQKLLMAPPKTESETGKLADVLKMVKEMNPVKEDKSMDFLIMLVKQQADTNQILMKAIMEKPAQAQAPADPFEMLNRFIDLQGKMEERIAARLSNNGGDEDEGPKRSGNKGWMAVAEAAAPTFLNILGSYLHNNAMMAQQGQGQGQGQPQPGPNPNQLPPGAGGNVVPINHGQPSPANQPNQSPPQQEDPLMMLKTMLKQVMAQNPEPLVTAVFNGENGANFADSMALVQGEGVVRQIQTLGKEGLMEVMRGVPNVWNRLGMKPQETEKFIEEFMLWPEGMDDGGEEGVVG